MLNYIIYYREADENIKAVQIGWNSDAMKLGIFWTLSNKLWGHFLVSILFLVGAALASLYFGTFWILFTFLMLIHVELALHGNSDYLPSVLYKDSYIEWSEIKANTQDEAESIFRKEQAELKCEVDEMIEEDKRYEGQIKRDEEEWENFNKNKEEEEEVQKTKNSNDQDIETARENLINNKITLAEYEIIKKEIQENLKKKESVSSSEKSNKKNNYITELRGAKELLDSGAINLAEFEKLKQKIMSEL